MPTYYVKLRCVVIKQLECECDTEDQAADEPFEHAIDEMEIDQEDYEVLDVQSGFPPSAHA